MAIQDRDFPNYYDGSSHLEMAEDMTDGLDSRPKESSISPDEWRRFIGANPFGMSEE